MGEANQAILNARVMSCEQMLEDVRRQLLEWAVDSQVGGWSTHQVKPQQKLAAEIRQFLDQK